MLVVDYISITKYHMRFVSKKMDGIFSPGQARYSFCAPIISNKIDNKFEKKREGVDPPEEKNIFSSGKRF